MSLVKASTNWIGLPPDCMIILSLRNLLLPVRVSGRPLEFYVLLAYMFTVTVQRTA
jgi:hypothetical protein